MQTVAVASTLNLRKGGLRSLRRAPISPGMELQDSVAIHVNGDPRRVTVGVTIAEMLSELGLDPRKVAVERNHDIVPRSALGEVRVAEGDTFEIVHFVGGG